MGLMLPHSPNNKDLGRYLAIGQVGLEMVAPIILGVVLDTYLNWSPWGVVVGATVGLIGGMAHLIQLANRANKPPKRDREAPRR
jgi:F0F1-type ATP synthase assembly protein I